MADVSERLKKLRKENKMSQRDVAKFLGISESGYGYYEQGRNEPSIDMIKRLADRYDVTADYLLGRSDTPQLSEEEEFKSFANNPELERFYRELPQSDEEDLEKLRAMWEIIKKKDKKNN
ncbi:Helix-turn-helix [Halobacillus dabanensis]|uniref:Helix-turn-helix n=1 Tax=Halobacillus dabanensis TaxID=240302 RepID=A0A1I3ZXD8_HALDA|nr:helix-turn-helix domain-containing protein [Halobacillus dabanensis]SFK48351.1 Helix-turn-helix [Halobacillus dabanensis]